MWWGDGITKYSKGPQRTTREHYTGPQGIGNHEKTARLRTILCKIALLCHFLLYTVFTKPCVTVSVARRSRRGHGCKSTVFFCFFFFTFLKKEILIVCHIFFNYFVLFVIFSSLVQCHMQEHIQTFLFLFCVIMRSALDRWQLPRFLFSNGTLL